MRLSVIIPVYNPGIYLDETLRSLAEQTMDAATFEIIAVDDGSTDGSDRVLANAAATFPNLRVLTQENSGSAGKPRNVGLDNARGEYVFFLDADDLLAPFALERMVDVADEQGSDVVLVKMKGLNGRKVPERMFTRTWLNAPLVESKAFYTLGPTRLIRRSMIERLGLRFPEDQKVGEDQPFMAAAYINASSLSILADDDYYIVRRREDAGNITSTTKYSAMGFHQRAVRLAAVIEKYTEPGDLRDSLLFRPFGWGVANGLQDRWLQEPADVQEEYVRRSREDLRHLYNDSVRSAMGVYKRAKIDLVMAGDVEGVRRFLTQWPREQDLPRIRQDGAFVALLPDWVPSRPEDSRRIGDPRVFCQLTEVHCEESGVHVEADVSVPGLDQMPDDVVLRAIRLSDGQVVDTSMTVRRGSAPGEYHAAGALITLAGGEWRLAVLVRVDDFERVKNLSLKNSVARGAEVITNDPAAGRGLSASFRGKGETLVIISSRPYADDETMTSFALQLGAAGECRALLRVPDSLAPGGLSFEAAIQDPEQAPAVQRLDWDMLATGIAAVALPVNGAPAGRIIDVLAAHDGRSASVTFAHVDQWPAQSAGITLEHAADGALKVTPHRWSRWRRHLGR